MSKNEAFLTLSGRCTLPKASHSNLFQRELLMCDQNVFDEFTIFIYLFICALSKTNKCLHDMRCVVSLNDDTSLLVVFVVCFGWHSHSHTLDLAQCMAKRRGKNKPRLTERNGQNKK